MGKASLNIKYAHCMSTVGWETQPLRGSCLLVNRWYYNRSFKNAIPASKLISCSPWKWSSTN